MKKFYLTPKWLLAGIMVGSMLAVLPITGFGSEPTAQSNDFHEVADECARIARANNRKFKRSPGSILVAREIVNSGFETGCIDYEAFILSAELVHAHEPDFGLAFKLGKLYFDKNDEVHALEFLEDALGLAGTEEEKSEVRTLLNRIYRSKTNYDEYQVPNYTLPDPLKDQDGKAIADPADWNLKRRKEILSLFEKHVYGKVPEGFSPELVFETHESDASALGGKATRRQVSIRLKNDPDMHSIDVLMYIPNHREGPAPAFAGLSFYGNPTIHPDRAIRMTDKWMRANDDFKVQNNRLTEASRGVRASRWPVEKIIDRGYALITAYYGDLDPDMYHAHEHGIYKIAYKDGQARPAPDEWGSIAVWAWGLSRIMDYLELDRDIDHDKVAVMGHSRIGKTALWAGATDDRFSIVISNNSGCGGAALSRRKFGETVAVINTSFPHWFCDNFNSFNKREDELPVDQHMLLSLIAPRPLYVASALEDRWADPKGEFLSAYHASRVYELLGYEGLPVDAMPSVNQPVMGTIGYHIREGKHDVTDYDWEQYMNFADKHFGKK